MNASQSRPPQETTILSALQGSSSKEIISLLFRFGLAEQFFRALKERELVFKTQGLSSPEQIQAQAQTQFKTKYQLDSEESLLGWCRAHGLKEDDFLSEAIHHYRLNEFCELLIGSNRASLYLRYKQKLDRVLYSLIRHSDQALVRHLYYAIEAGEMAFRDAARTYSGGVEGQTEGIVGPVDLSTPHPEIAGRLTAMQPGALSEPFEVDGWYAIVRLEYRFDSEFDAETNHFLGEHCLKAHMDVTMRAEVQQIMEWLLQP